MQVIGHQQYKVHPPVTTFVAERNGFKKPFGQFAMTELVLTASIATDGDEKDLFIRGHGVGWIVGKYLALLRRHEKVINTSAKESPPFVARWASAPYQQP